MSKNQRIGKREKRNIGNRGSKPDLGYYIIITDTEETEQNYMNGLRDSIPPEYKRRLIIKVRETKTSNLVNEALERAALNPQYAEPWIVFDRDQVKNFDEIVKDATLSGVNVGWSNPCIEVWFGAYFGSMPTYQGSIACCSGFGELFEKSAKQKYKKSDKLIYSKLCSYGNESNAINLAQNKLDKFIKNGVQTPSEMCPATTVHKLISEIKSKINK